MLHDLKAVTLTKSQAVQLEGRDLGVTRIDRIKNEYIRETEQGEEM